MDSIFEYVLVWIDYNGSYAINDIIKAPVTKLFGAPLLDCDDSFSSIAINVDLSVSSIGDKSNVYGIFGDDGIFALSYQVISISR